MISRIVLIILFCLTFNDYKLFSQSSETDISINQYRKGELIIKAKPGSEIIVEQISHEFWFGCAISDKFFNSPASKSDTKKYKELFLKNFNSAVTENAIKWMLLLKV